MVIHTRSSLFDLPADVLVNTVNCVGPWGKGIALACKTRFPGAYRHYREHLATHGMRPGDLLPCALPGPRPCWLLSIATKQHWRDPSRLSWVQRGTQMLRLWLMDRPATLTVAVPALGCGNGGLDWTVVRPSVAGILAQLPHTIWLCDPAS